MVNQMREQIQFLYLANTNKYNLFNIQNAIYFQQIWETFQMCTKDAKAGVYFEMRNCLVKGISSFISITFRLEILKYISMIIEKIIEIIQQRKNKIETKNEQQNKNILVSTNKKKLLSFGIAYKLSREFYLLIFNIIFQHESNLKPRLMRF